ncbi:MAG: hypothetical protein AAGC60_20700 [Acidobacteriota bacterium]
MPPATLDTLLTEVDAGQAQPVVLITGDLVAVEPQAERLATAIAEASGSEVTVRRRPERLGLVFDDLRTAALFGSGKVVLAVDTALLADAAGAADLIDQAADGLPFKSPSAKTAGDAVLDGAGREGAARLFQALRLFGVDPHVGDAAAALDALPDSALRGGAALRKKSPRGRSKKAAATLREDLEALLEAGRIDGIQGVADGDLANLGELIRGRMPPGHHLVLAERTAAADHPLVQDLRKVGALLELGRVEAGKGGAWQGLEPLVAALEAETGVGIERPALEALAQRTLRQKGGWKDKGVESDSTARLAGEYRKLADLARGQAGGGRTRITAAMVQQAVKDRGDEDVWKILDAVGEGRGAEALSRYRRLIESADNAIQARLSFFGLLANFCRQLSAIGGMARVAGVPANVRNYNQFKQRWAPALQGEIPGGGKSPLAGLHPYRLHRAYLAASRIDRAELGRLPWLVLETELQIKGEASDPDVAMAKLLSHLCTSRA